MRVRRRHEGEGDGRGWESGAGTAGGRRDGGVGAEGSAGREALRSPQRMWQRSRAVRRFPRGGGGGGGVGHGLDGVQDSQLQIAEIGACVFCIAELNIIVALYAGRIRALSFCIVTSSSWGTRVCASRVFDCPASVMKVSRGCRIVLFEKLDGVHQFFKVHCNGADN